MKNNLPRLVLTAGEPSGIGAEIIQKALMQSWHAEIIVIGDPDLFRQAANPSSLSIDVQDYFFSGERVLHQPNCLRIFPVKLSAPVEWGILNAENAPYVIETLHRAHEMMMQNGERAALVTAPVHKGILSASGMLFQGHTEFFRDACSVPKTIMLFVTDEFKTALMTTHVPLKDVSSQVNRTALRETLILLDREIEKRFGIASPRIAVCGLNPHAGEGGLLGDEEQRIIQPVIDELNAEGLRIQGAFPADTAFTPERLSQYDVILGMYHDQVLPLVKYLGFGASVNVTLGLPYIRTSVDHGTALDIAGQGKANAGSLCQAMACALEMIG